MSNGFTQFPHAMRALILALLVAPLGCDPAKRDTETAAGGPGTEGAPGESAGAAGGATVDDITDEATPFLGRSVTVTGEVGRIGGPQLFTIEDDDPVGDEHLLVLSARPVTEILADSKNPLADDDEVEVTGTVRRLAITEIERELGFDLEPEYEVEFRERPILVATSVRRVTGGSSAQPDAAAEGAPVTDVLLLVPVPGPRELVGRPVRLNRVPVQTVVSDKGFWVGPRRGQQVFVRLDEVAPSGASTEQKVNVQQGQQLTVFGKVEWVPAKSELEAGWGLSPAESKILGRNEALYIAADSVRITEAV